MAERSFAREVQTLRLGAGEIFEGEAILAVKKYAGAEGEYNFDQNGDGLHGYNVVRNEKGTIVYDKHIDFND